jgi:hypothetical protein
MESRYVGRAEFEQLLERLAALETSVGGLLEQSQASAGDGNSVESAGFEGITSVPGCRNKSNPTPSATCFQKYPCCKYVAGTVIIGGLAVTVAAAATIATVAIMKFIDKKKAQKALAVAVADMTDDADDSLFVDDETDDIASN